jgi:hypothetical protein
MTKFDEDRTPKLIQLARDRFDAEVTDAEIGVLRDSASPIDPTLSAKDDPRPEVRAEFVRWLATDSDAAAHIDPKRLRVWGATITGTLDLEGATVAAILDFRHCTFKQKINLRFAECRSIFLLECLLEQGMEADGVTVHGQLFLKWTESAQEIRLLSAHIEGNVECQHANFTGTDCGLSADRARIDGSFYLREGFQAAGMIRLVNAHIGSNLECTGAKLTGQGTVLAADGLEISGDVLLNGGFEAAGLISLPGARIGGDLSIFSAAVGRVACKNMCIAGDLIWQGIQGDGNAILDLTGAKVKTLRDDFCSWPSSSNLTLDGLEYEELTLHERPTPDQMARNVYSFELPLVAEKRIAWLLRQASSHCADPQPWMQLRDLMTKKGDDKGAKHVLYRFHCQQAQASGPLLRRWKIAFAWLQEQPLRILWSIALVLLLGTVIFSRAGAGGALAPTEAEAYKAWTAGKPMPAAYPALNPFVYVLENSLPLVKLGQDDKWAPDNAYPSKTWLNNYWFLMWARWVLILSGWFQATVLAAALSARFKE